MPTFREGILSVLCWMACTPVAPPDEYPELLTEIANVPAARPLEARTMRLAVIPGYVTLDLRPLAASLPEEKRRYVRKASQTYAAQAIRLGAGGSCNHFGDLLALARELGHTDPIDVEVHPRATMLEVAYAMTCIGIMHGSSTYRLVVRGPNGLGVVNIDTGATRYCLVPDDTPYCAGAYIEVAPQGIQILASTSYLPTRPGCVRGKLLDRGRELRVSRPPAQWTRKIMLLDETSCPSVPAAAKDPLGALSRAIRTLYAAGPGCPGATVNTDGKLLWEQVAPILATLDVSLETPIDLTMQLDIDEFHCDNGLLVEELARAARGHR